MSKYKPKNKKITVAVSGYFNPLHVGHLEMISRARKLGDRLVAIVNSDFQVALKGRIPFMSERDRLRLVAALRDVDEVVLCRDRDLSVCRTLAKIKPDIFANGGDRHSVGDVPEYDICQELGIRMVDGLGKKIRASSEILARAALLKESLKKKNKRKL